MKKSYLFLSMMLALACVACKKNADISNPVRPDTVVEGRTSYLSFSLSAGKATRANTSKTADEKAVNKIEAFVFNTTGNLDAYGAWTPAADPSDVQSDEFSVSSGVATTSESGRLSCSTGANKRIYVLVNADWSTTGFGAAGGAAINPASAISTEADLQALFFRLTSNQQGSPATLDNFQMIGYKTMDIVPGNQTASLNVESVVARIELKKITKNFSSAALNGAISIKGVYMTNVVGSYGIGSGMVDHAAAGVGDVTGGVYQVGSSNLWYNRTAAATLFDNDADLFANHMLTSPYPTIAEDASNDTAGEGAHVFYVMPNNVPWGYDHDSDAGTDDIFGPFGGDTWSPRHTKLVVVIEYGSPAQTYYYPIPIAENGVYPMGKSGDDGTGYAGIKANHSYEIEELELTRLGSVNPDEPVLPADVNFTITVTDWVQQLVQTESGKYVI